MHRISQCRRCKRDVCPSHIHLVAVEYLETDPPKWYAHLCDLCRTHMSVQIAPILKEFAPPEPAPVETRSEPT